MKITIKSMLLAGVCALSFTMTARPLNPQTSPAGQETSELSAAKPIKKILFIGDSMTGWLSEALNAYGVANGFEVSTIVWDGSTINKWGHASKLQDLINTENPDAVFVSLGMNELFEAKPEARFATSLDKIKSAVGNRKLVWVGPPSWPGHNKGKILNDWLAGQLGDNSFFNSFNLTLPRQSASNPHPSRQGMIQWVDSLASWLSRNPSLRFDSLTPPKDRKMVRGNSFIYKKMKDAL